MRCLVMLKDRSRCASQCFSQSLIGVFASEGRGNFHSDGNLSPELEKNVTRSTEFPAGISGSSICVLFPHAPPSL